MKHKTHTNPKFTEVVLKLMQQPLPYKVANKLRAIAEAIDDEAIKYETTRKELLNKLGKKKEDGTLDVNAQGAVQFDGDNFKKFEEALNNLLNEEFDVKALTNKDLEELTVSAADLLVIKDLISS